MSRGEHLREWTGQPHSAQFLPFEGRWPLKGVGGVSQLPEETPKVEHFPGPVTPLRRARARHLPSKGRICAAPTPRSATQGFTLIEMLVALAVFSLAALALIKLDSSTIRTSAVVHDHLLARITLNSLAVEVLTDPIAPPLGQSAGQVVNGGQRWLWSRQVSQGDAGEGLVRVDLAVSDAGGQPLVTQTLVRAVR
jgi:general secretion pathway protein I